MVVSYKIEILQRSAEEICQHPGQESKEGQIVRYIESAEFDGAIREVVARFSSPEDALDFGKSAHLDVLHIFPLKVTPRNG